MEEKFVVLQKDRITNMGKRILVPTDLTVGSLSILKQALKQEEGEQLHVVVMYAEYLSDSIIDLLFYTSRSDLSERVSDAFREALEVIKNRYAQTIVTLQLVYFRGKNNISFDNHLDAWKIDHIYIPDNYTFTITGRGFDPLPFLKKSKKSFTPLHIENGNHSENLGDLVHLFTD